MSDGILAGMFERRFKVSQEPPGWIVKNWGWDTASGVDVNEENALESTAVMGCIRILAETIASLPLITYRKLSPRGKVRAPDHYLYSLLHDAPNAEMTAYEFREALQGHLAARGNAFSEIEFDRAGRVRALWPLRPDRMKVRRVKGELIYEYTLPDKMGREPKELTQDQVLHLRGLGSNGIVGYSPVQMARQAIGLAKGTEEFGGRFFGSGARPGGVLSHPGKLDPGAHKRMKASWDEAQKGLEKSHRIAILEEGVSYQQIGISPEDSQFLETRKFQTSEIARIWRIPPHMLADLDRATFSNIEHLSLEFVMYTMAPWFERWEQRIHLSLLTPREREQYFVEHLVSGLLRGDIQTRYNAYAVGRQWGWFSTNDVRELENLNPIEGGDTYMVPLNMIPADSISSGMLDQQAPGERGQLPAGDIDIEERTLRSSRTRHRMMSSYKRIYRDAAVRIFRREIDSVRSAANKFLGNRNYSEFSLWLDDFYREHLQFIFRHMSSVNSAYGEAVSAEAQEEIGEEPGGLTPELERFIRSYTDGYAAKHAGISEDRIRMAAQEALADGNLDPLEQIEAELNSWEETRPNEIAMEESTRFNNATALTVYAVGGVQKLMSVAHGKNCPYCNSLNGKIIAINSYFLKAGEALEPDDADGPLKVSKNMRHAPYHKGCDCTIQAVL